ncbi:MAG: exo-alpha-sialidase, partial [Planctomycetota bacterium]
DRYLYAAKELAGGDFHIRARLSLAKFGRTAASFVLGGDHFGFDGGNDGQFFVEGPTFGRTRMLGPARSRISPGRPFEFEAICKAGRLTVRIDGREVYSTVFRGVAVGSFGFRPWRGAMRVYDFSADGRFTKPLASTDVFVSGQDGYNTYRIPSVIVTKRGALLAFAEGRKGGRGDSGNIDIVLKRSEDGGKTWSAQQVVWDDGGNTCGNPCPVVDRDTGTIWLALTWNHGRDHERDIIAGKSAHPRRPFMSFSEDDGRTWSKPADISATARRDDWGWYATGPGVSIQIGVGKYKGRLVVPANHSSKDYKDHRYGAHVVYSDDHGKTWRHSEPIRPGCNESQVFERVDGTLVMNMRSYNGKGCRAIATSTDGGETWSEIHHDKALIESVCQASVLRLRPSTERTNRTVLFSNPATTRGRTKMTVRTSLDDGRTWPVSRLVHAGGAAYSCLTVLPDGDIGLYYERDGYKTMTFVRFGFEWLKGDDATSEKSAGPEPRRGYGIPLVDLADQEHRQIVVDREKGQYLGHPTTVLLEDNRTMICVYPKGHGRGAIVMKRSTDGGLTWSERLPTPANWATSQEVPTIYRTVDSRGVKRLVMFSGRDRVRMAVSEDDGATWTGLRPIGDYGGIVAMSDMVRLKDGRYITFFHRRRSGVPNVFKTVSTDGGLTWNEPVVIAAHPKAHLCEAGAVRSPGGRQIALLLRENSRRFNSFVVFSDDEGETWSEPRELPGALTGDRHQAVYAPDGRLVISFRDRSPKGTKTPTDGDWVAWVGTYDDIVSGREGQYRVRLMDNKHKWDCAYPAMELLPDGTIVATTYGHWTRGEKPYIVSVRFKVEEIDELARKAL